MTNDTMIASTKLRNKKQIWSKMKRYKFIYLLMSPAILLIITFAYLPMPGIAIAFMNYSVFDQFSSPWCGFDNFINVLSMPMFMQAILNTIKISLCTLFIGFPAPIVFALLMNELKNGMFKRLAQTISYLPHFLSWISVIGIVMTVYSINGPINDIRIAIFGPQTQKIMFLTVQNLFIPNVVILDLWKGLGWSSIIYLAAMSGIDSSLYEAAVIDGANRWKQTIHVTLPSILPTIIILLIWKLGSIFGDNFELIYGLQNPFINYEVIATVIYKQGIKGGQYGLTTAFGLAQGFVNLILLLTANTIAKKVTEISVI